MCPPWRDNDTAIYEKGLQSYLASVFPQAIEAQPKAYKTLGKTGLY
jgi:hypothetical protein